MLRSGRRIERHANVHVSNESCQYIAAFRQKYTSKVTAKNLFGVPWIHSSIRPSINILNKTKSNFFFCFFTVIPTDVSHLDTPWKVKASATNELKPKDFNERMQTIGPLP